MVGLLRQFAKARVFDFLGAGNLFSAISLRGYLLQPGLVFSETKTCFLVLRFPSFGGVPARRGG